MNNENFFEEITYLFYIYLILALVVERIVEVLVAAFKYAEYKYNFYDSWNRRARVYQMRYDRLYGYLGEGTEKTQKVVSSLLWKVISKSPYEFGREVIEADFIRRNYIRCVTGLMAFLLSLGLINGLGFELISNVFKVLPYAIPSRALTMPSWFLNALNAFVISIGTQTLHKIIRGLEKSSENEIESPKGGVL